MKRIGGILLAFALALGLGLGFERGLGAGRATAQVQPSEAETMFWNRVKDTRNAAELRAYLDAFPNGAFAEVARARLQSMVSTPRPSSVEPTPTPRTNPEPRTGGAEPPPRTASPMRPSPPSGGGPSSVTPPPSTGAGSVLANAAVAREVQERLYNLNYQVDVTGRVDDLTRKAISDWQNNTKRPVSGDLDTAQLQALREARLPVTWGAIAYVARGASSVVWNRSSRRDAERDALAECKKNGGANCKVVTAADKGCGALGFYQGNVGSTTHWGAYASVRPTLAQAIDNALTECRAQAKRPDACGVRLQFCADGSHKQ